MFYFSELLDVTIDGKKQPSTSQSQNAPVQGDNEEAAQGANESLSPMKYQTPRKKSKPNTAPSPFTEQMCDFDSALFTFLSTCNIEIK